MTIKEIRDRVADMVTELLALSHGLSFESVMGMYWDEFSFWHKKTVETAKRLKGLS
jgi:hypothetical protein